MTAYQGQDPKILKEQEYADDSQLDIRYRTHQLHTIDPVNFGQWTLERLPWRSDERVLDVGCGPGGLLCKMARRHTGWAGLVGFNFSEGMIAKARQEADGLPASFFVADAQAIPHPAASFDVVMARHMLYHVPDIDRAVAEATRVLKPGGFFLATTNSAHTMYQSAAIRSRATDQFPA
jgi:ubiquinone/menaquinone biosynthesis C-methylase UbiE